MTSRQNMKHFKKFSYSKHHASERWDLEFGLDTTEKFENSRGEAELVFKFFRGV